MTALYSTSSAAQAAGERRITAEGVTDGIGAGSVIPEGLQH
jgi:hypothetical protein